MYQDCSKPGTQAVTGAFTGGSSIRPYGPNGKQTAPATAAPSEAEGAEGGTSGTLVTEILGAPQRETGKEKQGQIRQPLGNIGALASKPVMEGKSMLFKTFADVDAFDIEVDGNSVKAL